VMVKVVMTGYQVVFLKVVLIIKAERLFPMGMVTVVFIRMIRFESGTAHPLLC
jgi:hypothetical protein